MGHEDKEPYGESHHDSIYDLQPSDLTPLKRNLYQVRALFYKNTTVQLRQKKTNCCQLCTPIIFMLILGLLGFAYDNATSVLQPTTDYPVIFSALNSTFPCNETGTLNLCGKYDHLYYTNPAGGDVGTLSNQTDPNPPNSGFLSRIPQLLFQTTQYYNNGTVTEALVPFFDLYDSPQDIDTEIFNLLEQRLENITIMWSMPTGVILFNEVETGKGISQTLDYILQMQPNGVTTVNLEGYSQMYPNDTVASTQDRTTEYISYLNGVLLSTQFGIPENDTQIEIKVITQSMMQKHFPYIYPMVAVGGCSIIPFSLGFLLPVFVYLLVLEKSEKHLEMMRIMGMKKWVYWVVNFVFDFILYFFIMMIVIITGLSFQMDLFLKTDPIVYLTLFVLWGVTLISFSFLVASLFSDPKTASIVSLLLVFLGIGFAYEISLWLVGPVGEGFVYYGLYMLFPPFPFVRGVYLLEHPFFVPQFDSPYSRGVFLELGADIMICFYYMIGISLVCLVLTVYFDKVMPRTYGVQEHPLFPIFWIWAKLKKLAKKNDNRKELEHSRIVEDAISPTSVLKDEDCVQERDNAHNPDYPALLRIVNMHKKYKVPGKPEKVALKQLSLTVAERECFGLLGPNGAGKTTLQSILCGLIAPTSGHAVLAGYRIPEETEAIYTMIGYCPQYDVVWDELTVLEHLLFYCRIKGIPPKVEKGEALRLAARVQLEDSINKRSKELSGGMKRRLSVAISLIGDPKFVLLDEPSTGVDPVSRRTIWDILAREKEGRALILTTHNMQEAEVLCNRIGIMAGGSLLCVGTQAHLKRKYGSGFTLQVSVDDSHAATKFVQELFPTAHLESSISGILCFRIPQSVDLDLSQLFSAMQNKHLHGIAEWGINQTTLEEVFLRTVEMEEQAAL